MSKTLWSGRYDVQAADALRRLNDSLPFDKRLYASDVKCSAAYARALADAGVITHEESHTIANGLQRIVAEFMSGQFEFAAGDEDIHTAVERRLTEIIGPLAGKLHTGRSRNDQVATDIRHWQAGQILKINALIVELAEALLTLAGHHLHTLMPGYTHLRAAQPITAAHWLMSVFWMLARDIDRFTICRDHALVSPLGSGALAGNPYPIDRAALAEAMGFTGVTQNSLDGVSDRDFVVEFLSAASLLMVHLSRFAEDVILYSSPPVGFIGLDERYTTGS
ncbi:MAG TPA: argininosuccinate lyase, partial [Aggregatilineales bacterium]|nr:argininosuccinate lyase [Aggregatilineales bacterium]